MPSTSIPFRFDCVRRRDCLWYVQALANPGPGHSEDEKPDRCDGHRHWIPCGLPSGGSARDKRSDSSAEPNPGELRL